MKRDSFPKSLWPVLVPGGAHRWLSRALHIVCAFIILSPTLIAQRQSETRSWAYLFGGVGGTFGDCNDQGFYHLGGGGEGLFSGGLGLSAELGYLGYFDLGGGTGIFSPGVVYAFNRDRDLIPFVNAGYTLFFRTFTGNGFFFGGGVNKWIGEKWGIRIEGRSQVFEGTCHFPEARFAIILR